MAKFPDGWVFIPKFKDLTTIIVEQRELVCCKNCKHSCDYTDIYIDYAYKCTKNGGYHNDCWFCADGERKD